MKPTGSRTAQRVSHFSEQFSDKDAQRKIAMVMANKT